MSSITSIPAVVEQTFLQSTEIGVPFLAELLFACFFALSVVILRRSGGRPAPSKAAASKQSLQSRGEHRQQHASNADQVAVIRVSLAAGKVDEALRQTLELAEVAHVPAAVVAQLVRDFCQMNRAQEVFDALADAMTLPVDAAAALLEDCLKRDNTDLARSLDEVAQDSGIAYNVSAFDSILKIYSALGDSLAFERFKQMQKSGQRISEGLCVALLSRCAAPKFGSFAEEVTAYARSSGKMSLNMYSALMKVYSYDGKYEKACRLYDELLKEGLKPDTLMVNCVMRFALESGRLDLLPEMKTEAGADGTAAADALQYVVLLRACVQNKDVEKAFDIFRTMKAVLPAEDVDVRTYNVLLDVCVAAGQMRRARELVKEMPEGLADEVSYNVLLKGYCAAGDAANAQKVFEEMTTNGKAPGSTAYNCLLNMHVSAGQMHKAWQTLRLMDKNQVAVDKYTISIMMKSLRNSQDCARDLRYIMDLLENSGLDLCDDEVMLAAVLETCVKQREMDRVQGILKRFEASTLLSRAGVHTHAVAIKAYGMLRNIDKCRELWRNMVANRCLEPNGICIGCMLDALVCNGCVKEAMEFFKGLQRKGVKANAVMYSTLIKGLLNCCDEEGAMALFEEMRACGIKPNISAYNSLLDAQAKVGATERVLELVAGMQADGCEASDITHSMVVKSYCIAGHIEKAVELFYNIVSKDTKSYASTYNNLLSNCIQAKRTDLAQKLVDDLKKCHIVPTQFTLATVVKHYGRVRQLDAALQTIANWKKDYNIAASAAVKSCLIRACMHCGRADLGLRLLQEVKQEGDALDCRAYRSLILSCLQGDLLQEATQLTKEALGVVSQVRKTRTRPQQMANEVGMDVVESLCYAMVKKGQKAGSALPLLRQIQDAGVRLTPKLLAMLGQN
eukprot:TRINITY_DN6312_c0_g1_i1.p1 TRINITY_DN6312_c0_g1~~TRINITY_DN6312_c0_g1_i1.p1  ORF type:complete len:905 (+),score=307.22 TRINITY_DN6312_c0_g1_i1:145-2859(+)